MAKRKTPKHAWIWEDFDASHVDPPASGDEDAAFLAPGRRWSRSSLAALHVLLFLIVLLLLDAFSVPGVPPALTSLPVLIVLGLTVFFLALHSLIEAQRALAFYGRFIRPGLRHLLEHHKGRLRVGDEKLFRGRKTVVMKIDMANYTRTTFRMPYGMRRLFQDLWFTLIDQVVAEQVFLDKSLGDGSLYFFEDGLPGGSASAALRAALTIRGRQVELFDRTYRRRLEEMINSTPEIAGHARTYLERYERAHGESFWKRRTLVRIALVAGYVDEGLWGLSSQSHYDVQGGALVLASRMEAAAENGEIVFDRHFLEELEEEGQGLVDRSELERREVDLKGVGTWEVYALREAKHGS